MPGLSPVADHGEAPGRAAGQQHLPLGVGQFLRLIHHDVGERPGQLVRFDTRQRGLVDQGVGEILAAQHAHQADAVLVVGRLDQVIHDPGHPLPLGRGRGRATPLARGRLRVAESLPGRVQERKVGNRPRLGVIAL